MIGYKQWMDRNLLLNGKLEGKSQYVYNKGVYIKWLVIATALRMKNAKIVCYQA